MKFEDYAIRRAEKKYEEAGVMFDRVYVFVFEHSFTTFLGSDTLDDTQSMITHYEGCGGRCFVSHGIEPIPGKVNLCSCSWQKMPIVQEIETRHRVKVL